MSDAASQGPELHCLHGGAAPQALLEAWQAACALPASARESIWELLGPTLSETTPDDFPARVQRFCATHGVEAPAMAEAVEVCGRLLHQAAIGELDGARFREDLVALGGEPGPLRERLVEGFEPATRTLRERLAERTLREHGPVLLGLSWRIQRLASSDVLPVSDIPIVSLSFRTRDGARDERFTTQATLDAVRQLRDACNVILSRVTREKASG